MTDYQQKFCFECEHFYLDLGTPGYSDRTPAGLAIIECLKNHYSICGGESYKEVVKMARTCLDFKPDPEMVEYNETQHE